MPLFNKSRSSISDTDNNRRGSSASPDRKRGLLSSRRASAGSFSDHDNNKSGKSGTGLFGRRRNKSRSIDHDPSIVGARQKVSKAEQAEKDADNALKEARKHVQLARENVRTLEQEALEESRVAKLKQAEAKVITKTAKSLGRHGP